MAADLVIAAPDREQLIAAFGMVGIRIAISLIHTGAKDAPALAAELVRHSGLEQLRATLSTRFGSRNRQLKVHSALRTLRSILLRHRSPHTVRVFRSIDRLLADNHCFTELRLLAGLAALPVPGPTRTALDHVLGGRGISATTRLGLPPDASPNHTRAVALRHQVLARSARRTLAGPAHHPHLPSSHPQLRSHPRKLTEWVNSARLADAAPIYVQFFGMAKLTPELRDILGLSGDMPTSLRGFPFRPRRSEDPSNPTASPPTSYPFSSRKRLRASCAQPHSCPGSNGSQ